MKPIYNLENIHDMLLKKYPKFEWNYEIYEMATGKKRPATIEDFTQNLFSTIELAINFKDEEYSLDVAVSNFNFIIYEDEPNILGSGSTQKVKDNLSSNWVDLLLEKHAEEYAKMLLIYSERNKRRIKDEAEQKIAAFSAQINQTTQKESSHYEELSKKAKCNLKIADLVKTIREL